MHQIKLFKSIESEISDLEREINAWLAESGATVINVFGNIAPQTIVQSSGGAGGRTFAASDLFLAVVYEK